MQLNSSNKQLHQYTYNYIISYYNKLFFFNKKYLLRLLVHNDFCLSGVTPLKDSILIIYEYKTKTINVVTRPRETAPP